MQVSLPPLLVSYPHIPPSTSVNALHVHCPLNHLISSNLLSFCLSDFAIKMAQKYHLAGTWLVQNAAKQSKKSSHLLLP